MSGFDLEFYEDIRENCTTDDFLDLLQDRHRAKILKFMEVLQEKGYKLPRPYCDHVEGEIRELRINIQHHGYRFLFFFYGKHIVITHGLLKKGSEIPNEEIAAAKARRKDWVLRYG